MDHTLEFVLCPVYLFVFKGCVSLIRSVQINKVLIHFVITSFFFPGKKCKWTEKLERSVCGSEWPTHRDEIGWNHNICHASANRTLRRWFIVQSRCAIGSSSRVRLRVGWLSRKTENFYTLDGGVHGESQTNVLMNALIFTWRVVSRFVLACMSCSVWTFAWGGSAPEDLTQAQIICVLSLLCKSAGNRKKISLIWLGR